MTVEDLLRWLGRAVPLNPLNDALYRAVVPAVGLLPDRPATVTAAGRRFKLFTRPARSVTNNPDFYLYYFGTWEPRLARALRRLIKPGDLCVDVGANLGWYTLVLSDLVGSAGRVYAFEPDPRAFARLTENLALNPDAVNVVLEPCAVGARSGEVALHLGESDLYSSVFVDQARGGTPHRAPMVSLDEYVRTKGVPRVDFVKCDAEGAELEVFRGGEATLGTGARPPMLQLEVNPETAAAAGFHPRELLDWLADSFGYHFYAVNAVGRLSHRSTLTASESLSDVFALVPERHGDRLVRTLA